MVYAETLAVDCDHVVLGDALHPLARAEDHLFDRYSVPPKAGAPIPANLDEAASERRTAVGRLVLAIDEKALRVIYHFDGPLGVGCFPRLAGVATASSSSSSCLARRSTTAASASSSSLEALSP